MKRFNEVVCLLFPVGLLMMLAYAIMWSFHVVEPGVGFVGMLLAFGSWSWAVMVAYTPSLRARVEGSDG